MLIPLLDPTIIILIHFNNLNPSPFFLSPYEESIMCLPFLYWIDIAASISLSPLSNSYCPTVKSRGVVPKPKWSLTSDYYSDLGQHSSTSHPPPSFTHPRCTARSC
eukprot:Protomagalhaensia_wolfi_Nauph_80__6000@NODE_815_length_1981_cov_286_140577_g612_i0_p2_GENE_NODE_815_length_1981_cov_286_140577_g612_i0NODE_815_length_1981_cov_286_140577_g612_i0_p2_ORF_typecomplete_len106_score8_13_NODE_815_length_1981_cov_286_140577_g612_i011151432